MSFKPANRGTVKGPTFMVNCDSYEQQDRWREFAAKHGMNNSALVRMAVEAYIKKVEDDEARIAELTRLGH